MSGLDALDKFRQEMGKLESLESEYHKVIFGKKVIRNIIQTVLESFFRRSRQEKRDFAQKAVDNNRSDKRFVKVLGIYVQNYLTIDELEADLKKFSPEVQKEQEWKDKMDFVKYSRLNLPGQKCIDFTVKGHDGKEIRLSDLLAKNKLVLIDFGHPGVVLAGYNASSEGYLPGIQEERSGIFLCISG